MIVIVEGGFGSGKSVTAVWTVVVPTLRDTDRHVCTNLPLVWDGLAKATGLSVDELGERITVKTNRELKGVFWEGLPSGTVCVFDEVRSFWGKAARRKDVFEAAMEYFRKHRHFCDDVYVLSQSGDDLAKEFIQGGAVLWRVVNMRQNTLIPLHRPMYRFVNALLGGVHCPIQRIQVTVFDEGESRKAFSGRVAHGTTTGTWYHRGHAAFGCYESQGSMKGFGRETGVIVDSSDNDRRSWWKRAAPLVGRMAFSWAVVAVVVGSGVAAVRGGMSALTSMNAERVISASGDPAGSARGVRVAGREEEVVVEREPVAPELGEWIAYCDGEVLLSGGRRVQLGRQHQGWTLLGIHNGVLTWARDGRRCVLSLGCGEVADGRPRGKRGSSADVE